MIRSEIDSLPTELDIVRRKLFTLETEREALLKENDDKSKLRLEDLQKEIAELKSKDDEMTAKYEKEKGSISEIKNLSWTKLKVMWKNTKENTTTIKLLK